MIGGQRVAPVVTANRTGVNLDVIAAGGLLAVLAGVRLWLAGFAALSPDDVRYLAVGRSVLAGAGPVNELGERYLVRSPFFGTTIALGDRVLGLLGAHLVVVAATFGALLLVLLIAGRVGGRVGVWGAAAALGSLTLVWDVLPTVRIDAFQTGLVLAAVYLALCPTRLRAALGGVAVGLAMLTKETVALLVAVPLAWVGRESRTLRRDVSLWVGAAVLVYAWWPIYLATQSALGAPLSAGAGTTGPPDLRWSPFTWVALSLLGGSWAQFASRWRGSPERRVVLVSALLLLPPAGFAWMRGYAPRQYLALGLLSCVAVGVALSDVLEALRQWQHVRAKGAALVLVAAGCVFLGQTAVGMPRTEDPTVAAAVAWTERMVAPGSVIAVSFRNRGTYALEVGARYQIVGLPVETLAAGNDLSDYLWIGDRGGELWGISRVAWRRFINGRDVAAVILFGPHPRTPLELAPVITSAEAPGLGLVTGSMEEFDGRYVVEAVVDEVGGDVPSPSIPLHMTVGAAEIVLEKQGVAPLVQASPLVEGSGRQLTELGARLGEEACLARAGRPYTSRTRRISVGGSEGCV